MSGAGRKRPPGEESFSEVFGGETRPLDGPDTLRREPPSRRRAPAREAVRFVVEAEGCGRAEDVASRALAKLRRGDPAPEREIDLHGLDAPAAAKRVRRVLETAREEGVRCVLVIHGRGLRSDGEAVLRRALPEWLAAPPLDRLVQAFAPAPERLGGAGASLVLLRRERRHGSS